MDNAPGILTPKKTNESFQIDGEEYEVLPEVVNEAAIALLLTWEKLGKPRTVFSDSGEKLTEVIISTWRDLYKDSSDQWIKEREEYQKEEKSSEEQFTSHSGRSLASIPNYVFEVMKAFFKDDSKKDKDYYIKLVKRFPIFRMTNKV